MTKNNTVPKDPCGKCRKPKPCKCGRPSKLTANFILVAKGVLGIVDGKIYAPLELNKLKAIIHTDEDLLFLINERLEEGERIGGTTWKQWKAGNIEDSRGEEFRSLIKKALIQQREQIFTKMETEDPRAWQRWAWILERKFKEWNLQKRSLVGEDPDNQFKGLADLMKAQVNDE